MRIDYEMTNIDLDTLLEEVKPVPMIMLQCGTPPSAQERANAAWAALGLKMGFDPMTVRPNGKGDRFFSAMPAPKQVVKPHLRKDGSAWCATWPGFINLQESPAGFGDTPEDAVADLQAQGKVK